MKLIVNCAKTDENENLLIQFISQFGRQMKDVLMQDHAAVQSNPNKLHIEVSFSPKKTDLSSSLVDDIHRFLQARGVQEDQYTLIGASVSSALLQHSVLVTEPKTTAQEPTGSDLGLGL